MAHHHLLIGSGPAAINAITTIREFQDDATITLVGDEPAHSRMALPYWLAGSIPREQTYLANEAWYREKRVETHLGKRANTIDPGQRTVTLDDGEQLGYDRLLLATGSRPLVPPIPGADLAGVQTMWTLADTDSLLRHTEGQARPRVVLVGAGFIGFIVLGAMFKRGWQLSVVERESQVLPRMLDAGAASLVDDWLASRDVAVHAGCTVQAIETSDDALRVQLDNGSSLEADVVILATGIEANLELAHSAGLDVDQGILVDERMQTTVEGIYAAGDVAQGPVLGSSEREVHAIQPTAVDHGRVAGANMAGEEIRYPGSLSMNVVDVCGLQCASYGHWNDAQAEVTTIQNETRHIYRKLLWRGDRLVGAVFAGRAADAGMLTDLGMVKGILQTQTPLGPWKDYLAHNPFDIRRAYIGAGIAAKLTSTTLLGRPSRDRGFRQAHSPTSLPPRPHTVYVNTKSGD